MREDAFAALFERAQQGDRGAFNAVYQVAFFRLRGIAASLMKRERPAHTLQPTALVNEVFLKLHRMELRVLGTDHFYRLAARAMGQVLIDHARVRGKVNKVPLEAIPDLLLAGDSDPEARLAAREALAKLRAVDPRAADTVWLRCVEGWTIEEVSRRQGRQAWRVRADCDFGVQWLTGQLTRRVQ